MKEQDKGEMLQKIKDNSRNKIVYIEIVPNTEIGSYFSHIQNKSSVKSDKINGYATGFFIAPNLIVTNIHVVVSARSITIKQFDVKRSKEPSVFSIEGVIAFDSINDLIILKVKEQCTDYFLIGNSNTVSQGDSIFTFTYSKTKYKTEEDTINLGITQDGWFRINRQLTPGESGTPILNRYCEVIGIVNSINQKTSDSIGTTDFTYVSPSNVLKTMIEKSDNVEPLAAWQKHSDIRAYVEDIHANINLNKGQYYSALTNFDKALKLNPNSVKTYVNRGLTKCMLNDYEGTISDCDAALRLNPNLVQAYTNRIAAKKSLQDFEGALSDLDFLFQHFRDSVELFQIYFLRAEVNNNLGNLDEAIQDYTQAIQLKPDDHGVYYNRGKIFQVLGRKYANEGNVDEAYNLNRTALEDYNIAIRLNPEKNSFYFRRGIVQHKLAISLVSQENQDAASNYFQEALEDYSEVIRRFPWHISSYYNRGLAKYQLGKNETKRGNAKDAKRYYEDAIKDLNRTIQKNRKHVNAYNNRGNVKKALGQFEAAKEDYTKTIQLDPMHVSAHYNLGHTKVDLAESNAERGNLDKAQKLYIDALEDFNKAIQLVSENSYIYIKRGKVKRRLGSSLVDQGKIEEAQFFFQEAIADYSEVLTYNSKYSLAYNNRGYAKYCYGLSECCLGNEEKAREYYKDAIMDLDKTIKLNPEYVIAYYNRGKVKNALSMHEEAETDYAKAKELESMV